MRIVRIVYTTHFVRALRTLDPDLKDLIRERTLLFQTNCFDPKLKTHKLKGRLKDYWSYSLTHSHRVLFQFMSKDAVGFIDVGDHSIYK